MKPIVRWIRDQDEIVEPGYAGLHFQTDAKQKTCIGGLASLGVTLYVLYMAFTKGMQMLGLQDPYISSLEETMDYLDAGKVPMSMLAKPLFEVLEYGDKTVDLEAQDYKKYVHIRLRNIIKKYPNGELNVTNEYYWLRPCEERDFQRSVYEQNYWKVVQGERNQYCVDVPEGRQEPYMQGTRDSQYDRKEHAYFVYDIRKCTDAIREEGDPECAEPEEIEAWLRTKFATFKVINTKIDFNSFDDIATRQNEVFVPNIPLASGSYCDTGGRFRRNIFSRTDHWFVTVTEVEPFYDYVFYNSDCYVVEKTADLLGELYYRFEVDQINHTRVVLGFMDFIGTLGGVSDILLQILGWVLGGYAMFHSTFATVAALYKIKNTTKSGLFRESKSNDPDKPHLQKMKLTLCTRIQMYLTNQFLFSPLFSCLKNEKVAQYNEIVDQGCEMMEKELDIFTIVKNQRHMLFEIQQIKSKLNSSFEEREDSDSIIDIDPDPDYEDPRDPNYMPKWLKDEEALTLPSEKKLLRPSSKSVEATNPVETRTPNVAPVSNSKGEILMSEIKCDTEIEIPIEGKDRQDIADSRVLAQKGEGLVETDNLAIAKSEKKKENSEGGG